MIHISENPKDYENALLSLFEVSSESITSSLNKSKLGNLTKLGYRRTLSEMYEEVDGLAPAKTTGIPAPERKHT